MYARFRSDPPAYVQKTASFRGRQVIFVLALQLLPLPASACGVQDVFHFSSRSAAVDACRSFGGAWCVTYAWAQTPVLGTADDGHRYAYARKRCQDDADNYNTWQFHFSDSCPSESTANENGRCIEESGPSEEQIADAANAGDPSTCNGGEDAPPSLAAGNPIHIGTGNKYQREVDIADWSPFAEPLVRHYNSRTTDAPTGAPLQ